jgi:transposase
MPRKKHKEDRTPPFRCDCAKAERDWVVLEAVYEGPWSIVGCVTCHAIGRRKSEQCSAITIDQGEYEESLRAAVRRTERVARHDDALRTDRGAWLRGKRMTIQDWTGACEYIDRRKPLGTEVNSMIEALAE